jgi:hypothetical protein
MTGKTQGRRVLRCRLAPVDIGRLGLPAAPGDPNVAAVLARLQSSLRWLCGGAAKPILGATLQRLRSVNNPPASAPRKFDDIGVIASLGFSHPFEGEVNKVIPKSLIVGQFSQTNAFACVVGVVVGGHGEHSRWRLLVICQTTLADDTSSETEEQ